MVTGAERIPQKRFLRHTWHRALAVGQQGIRQLGMITSHLGAGYRV